MPTRLTRTAINGFVLVFFLFSLVGAGPVLAQETSDPPGYKVKNQEAVQKLRLMSKQEIENLDAIISQALELYYDRKYTAALPVFLDIAEKIETMDIMFWIGTSAARSGKLDLAKAQYEKMLQIDPSLDRVRLELATVYFAMGKNDAARKELETVKAGDPPAQVMASIQKLEKATEDRSRKYA